MKPISIPSAGNGTKPHVASSTVYNEHYSSVMSKYSDGYFDLAVCDIPYGIGVGKMAYLKEVNTSVKQKNGTRLIQIGAKKNTVLKNGIKSHRHNLTLMNYAGLS